MGRATFRLGWMLLVVALASLVLVPPLVLAARFGRTRSPFARLWYRTAFWALGWRLSVRGAPSASRPLLIVANHVSWADILVLGGQGELSFVAKAEVASWPVIGWLAKLQGTLFVERKRRRKAGEQARAVAGRLSRNAAVVLFAEGTTGDGNLLLHFKSTLFAALDLSAGNGDRPATVQPASIAYLSLHGVSMGRWERQIAAWIGERSLPAHLGLLARHGPLDAVLTWGEPFTAERGHHRKDLARLCEARVRALAVASLRGEASAPGAALAGKS